MTIPNAICMHEEDAGIGWKHTDFRTEAVEVRRLRPARRSRSIATVGNYEYGFFWYLYNDGTIEYEVKLTGVISTGAMPVGETPEHGVLVAPGLYGPHHQHFFCVRLDMAVDGTANTVVEVDSGRAARAGRTRAATPGTTSGRCSTSEVGGAADHRPAEGALLADREPVGAVTRSATRSAYKLMPGENVLPMFAPGLAVRARAPGSPTSTCG